MRSTLKSTLREDGVEFCLGRVNFWYRAIVWYRAVNCPFCCFCYCIHQRLSPRWLLENSSPQILDMQTHVEAHAANGGYAKRWPFRTRANCITVGASVFGSGFRRTCRVCGICWCGCMLNFRGVRVSLGTRWEDLLLIDAQWTNLHGTRFLRRSRSSKVLRLVDAWVRSPFAFSGT